MNIIFDGNYLFFKTLFVVGGYGKGGKALSEKSEQQMFIRKIATDMAHCIRAFGKPDRVIFTFDSRSWRKEVMIEEGDYKANRTKDESTIDWDSFYTCMNDFMLILTKQGYIVSKEERAEGDDLMYLWSDYFFNNGMDSIIVTGDRDLTQSVRCNGKNYVVVYNSNSKSRKIVAPKGFSEWLKGGEVDLFDANSFMNNNRDLIAEAANAIPVEEIDPKWVIFEKVIIGDAGDNVPSVWTWVEKEKNFRVTPKKAERIYELLNRVKVIEDVYELPDRCIEVSSAINSTCKQNTSKEKIQDRLKRNLQLVYLDKRIIPTEIQEAFNGNIEKYMKKPLLGNRNYDMNTILFSTDYVAAGKSFESDFFKNFS